MKNRRLQDDRDYLQVLLNDKWGQNKDNDDCEEEINEQYNKQEKN